MHERTADPATGPISEELPPERGLAAQWVGLLLAPAAFFLHLQFAYAVVPWACRHRNDFWIHASGVASVILAAIAPSSPGRSGAARAAIRLARATASRRAPASSPSPASARAPSSPSSSSPSGWRRS